MDCARKHEKKIDLCGYKTSQEFLRRTLKILEENKNFRGVPESSETFDWNCENTREVLFSPHPSLIFCRCLLKPEIKNQANFQAACLLNRFGLTKFFIIFFQNSNNQFNIFLSLFFRHVMNGKHILRMKIKCIKVESLILMTLKYVSFFGWQSIKK